MENPRLLEEVLAADLLVGEAFAHMLLSIRCAANSLSISDAQVEGKYSFQMHSNPTTPGIATDRKVRTQVFGHCRENPSLSLSPATFSDILSCSNSGQTPLDP